MFKIMVVDDERDVVELLTYILKNDTYEVYNAYNGKDALEKIGLMPSSANTVMPDLMILDVMMPEIDGYTVQTKMLENDKTRNVPIVILTAKGQVKELFKMASNVAGFIEKPFDPDELKHKINTIVEEIRTRKK